MLIKTDLLVVPAAARGKMPALLGALVHLVKVMLGALPLPVQVTVAVEVEGQEPLVVRHMELMLLMAALAALELHQVSPVHP
jgi:hypothetical protein